MTQSMKASPSSFVLVVGHESELTAQDGAASLLRELGAEVRTLDLWDDFARAFDDEKEGEEWRPRAVVFEAGERPDLAIASLRSARKEPRLAEVPALLAVPERQVARVEPSSGFDDFIVLPYFATELYARIRALEWRNSEFATEERFKVGALLIDRAAHEVAVNGRRVQLTAKEFALLAFLSSNRGRVYTRDALLARVWGARYEGGPRTVDIHVRRLRAKLGDALPLETMRGAGYKLRAPQEARDGEASAGPAAPEGSRR